MSNSKLKLIIISISFIIISNNAYAYLDPGTGSIILQTLAFLLAAGLAFFSNLWTKIKIFFQQPIFSRKSKTYIEEKEKMKNNA